MGGIDNIDRQLALTETIRKMMKLYRKLFFHFIDLSLTNVHVLNKTDTKKQIFFPQFCLEIVRALLKLEPSSSTPSHQPNDSGLTG